MLTKQKKFTILVSLKRNPFDEAECGHHYACAMAAWASINALTGFQYSAVKGEITFSAPDGTYF